MNAYTDSRADKLKPNMSTKVHDYQVIRDSEILQVIRYTESTEYKMK